MLPASLMDIAVLGNTMALEMMDLPAMEIPKLFRLLPGEARVLQVLRLAGNSRGDEAGGNDGHNHEGKPRRGR